jgi:hypothetical protein
MPSVIMLNVVMLIVVAPFLRRVTEQQRYPKINLPSFQIEFYFAAELKFANKVCFGRVWKKG